MSCIIDGIIIGLIFGFLFGTYIFVKLFVKKEGIKSWNRIKEELKSRRRNDINMGR